MLGLVAAWVGKAGPIVWLSLLREGPSTAIGAWKEMILIDVETVDIRTFVYDV